METPQTDQTNSKAAQIKIVANTADEAVKTIKDKFGEAARVLSVNQAEAGGLKRLISKPRLEVIVEVPRSLLQKAETKAPKAESKTPPQPEAEEATLPSKSADEAKKEEKIAEAATQAKAGNAVSDMYGKTAAAATRKPQPAKNYFSDFETKTPAAETAPIGSAANPVKRGTKDHVQRAVSMLEAVGFDRSLIERIRYDLDFNEIGDMPAMELYGRICDWLRNNFPNTKDIALGSTRAFIGSCGAGKTSALCKQLSADVFMSGLEPMVLKIDSDVPNPSDGLEAFCEIMNAPLFRDAEEVEGVSDERPLFIDMPGVNFSDPRSVADCKGALDELDVEDRILVINAAYESEMIAEALMAGERIGATRVVFTHLDETRRAGKLWKFVLNGNVLPLFFSRGSNPAGDYTTDAFSYLLEKTFPQSRDYSGISREGLGARPGAKEAVEA
ncbi:MAG: hypothetical protein AAGB46_15795 [Verrucomicrobiota bacterium]